MTGYVPAALRRLVVRRASDRCEYCRVHVADTFFGCQVDHVIAEKHGGETVEDNLCYACTLCNRAKGSDIGSITSDRSFTRFFNPRTDRWSDHFEIRGVRIEPLTDIGEVTMQILGFNEPERLLERETLVDAGRYLPHVD